MNLDVLNSYDFIIEGKGVLGFMNGNGMLIFVDDLGGIKFIYEIDV